MPSSDRNRYAPPAGVTLEDAFEMGFTLAASIHGQVIEDIRSAAPKIRSHDHGAVADRIDQIVIRNDFGDMTDPKHAAEQIRDIIRAALTENN